MKTLNDKVVWVTGASSGIGEALVYALCKKEGARVIISSRNKDELERVKNSLAAELQSKVAILPMDLENHEVIPLIVNAAINIYGRIDILINNAGISQRSFAAETDFNVDSKIIRINLLGTILLSKKILAHFLANKSGHFVVISSLVGKFGSKFRTSYAASKHGLHGFFDSLEQEVYDKGIKVTMICPGFIKTNVSINALTADGSPLNKMDNAQANGMSPDKCATKIISAVKKEKHEAYIGGKEIYMIWIRRFFPSLFRYIIHKSSVR